MKKIVLIGGEGHCSVVLDSLLRMGDYDIVGITDPNKKKGLKFLGMPILGNDSCLKELYDSGVKYAHVTVGSVGDFSLRKKLIDLAETIGFELVSIIDPSAVISQFSKIGKMTYVGKLAVVNSMTTIKDYCIINTNAVVEHGCSLQSHVHIAPSASLSGNVYIGDCTHIGINSTVIQEIHIGNHCLIGAGSVVTKDIPSSMVAVGAPARIIRKNTY